MCTPLCCEAAASLAIRELNEEQQEKKPYCLVICERLRIAPQPYLIAEVLASNIGGAATLIGDPPNIIIGSRAG